MSTLLGETVAESEADEVKALSEKLEIINLQFARRKAVRRAALHWLLIAVCGGILAVAAVLAAVNSPYRAGITAPRKPPLWGWPSTPLNGALSVWRPLL